MLRDILYTCLTLFQWFSVYSSVQSRYISDEDKLNSEFIELRIPLVFLEGDTIRQAALTDILLECTKVGRPLALGRQGAVFHFGAAEIVIAPAPGEGKTKRGILLWRLLFAILLINTTILVI